MSKTGTLRTDALFLGLTRPSMLLGVSQMYAVLNAYFCLSYFIFSTDLMAFFYAGIVHGIGMLICHKEPRFIELWMTKSRKCTKCSNKLFHGANSYDLY